MLKEWEILMMLKDFIEIWASYLIITKLGLLTLSHLTKALKNYMVDELTKRENFFNGNVKTDYYQFYGERPPKKKQ